MTEINLETLGTLVGECRALLENELCELIEELGTALLDETRVLASATKDRAKRNDYLHLHANVQKDWLKLAPVFRSVFAKRSVSTKPAERHYEEDQSIANLQILGDDELAGQLAMRQIVDRVSTACHEETSGMERRVNYLILRTALPQGDTTFRLAPIISCLETSCNTVFPDKELHILLMQLIGGQLASELPQLYRSINEVLIGADILPQLKRSYRNAPTPSADVASAESSRIIGTLDRLAKARTPVAGKGTAAPSDTGGREFFKSLQALPKLPAAVSAANLTNEVRIARDSGAARNMPAIEAVALDIVSELFDLIFGDAEISKGIKVLVGRLQMPVLKVAIQNQQFFADRSHPARRFLDSISSIAIRWGKSVNENDPFYIKLSELVERIQTTFDGDLKVFDAAITELAEFITEREVIEAESNRALAEAVHAREEEIRTQREGQARAQHAADLALAPLITPALPHSIEQFLTNYWRNVLQSRIYLSESGGPPYARTVQIVSELIWCVTPKKDADARRRQSAMLPTLVKNLNKGLDEIGISAEERRAFMDALVVLCMAALRGDIQKEEKANFKLDAKPRSKGPGPTLQVSHEIKGGGRVQDISLTTGDDRGGENTPDRANLRRVRQLVRGDWVDFISSGQSLREHLTWINPSRSLILFSNHASECAISITPEALALRLQNQTARLVKRDTPIFERALDGAVKSMDKQA